MADLSSLFDLDPTKYSTRQVAGSFNPVVSSNNRTTGIDIASILSGLQSPVQPELPKITVDPNQLRSLVEGMPAYINQIKQEWLQENPVGYYGVVHTMAEPDWNFKFANKIGTRPTKTVGETPQSFNTRLANYNMQQKYLNRVNEITNLTNQFNTESAAQQKVAGDYNTQVDAYNAELKSRLDPVYAALVDPAQLSGEASQTRGDQLGSTALYSDDLHNLMLSRIGQVNAEEDAALNGLPGAGSMSALFSSNSGGK